MRLIDSVRVSIFLLIGVVFLVLLIVLYNDGSFEIAGFRIDHARPATEIIVLCLLFAASTLLKKRNSFKEALSGSSLVLLICFVLILYLANYRTGAASDTAPARYLPMSLWHEGDFDLDEFRNLHYRAEFSGLIKVGSHYLSSYPVGAAIFALPYYLPSAIGPVPANSWMTSDLEKIAASFTVILSVVFLYFTILRISSHFIAILVAAIYALATSSFSVSSQALWQHGASQLCLSAAMYCLVRGIKEPLWIALAGFPAAFAVVCRPTDALLVIPMGLFVLFHRTRYFPGFLLSAIPPILFQLLYNKFYFDNFFRTQWDISQGSFWSTPWIDGAANILISPARGLLIYSPIFIFSFVAMIRCWKKDGFLLFRYLTIGVIANLLLYSRFFMWWGGFTYGPRLLADLSPILCSFLVCAIPALKLRGLKTVFVVLSLWSFSAHAIGAYADDPFWNADMGIDLNPKTAWIWNDNQLVNGPKRAFDALRIRFLDKRTTESDPKLFSADISTNLPEMIGIKASKKINFTVEARNTGEAVWLYGLVHKPGNVRLEVNWYRKERLLDRFSRRRRFRHYVFPGDSYRFVVRTEAPDREGHFVLEVAIALSQGSSEIRGKVQRIPVLVSR